MRGRPSVWTQPHPLLPWRPLRRPLEQFTNPFFPRNLELPAAASATGAVAGGCERSAFPRSARRSRNRGKAQNGARCGRAALRTRCRLFVLRHWPEIRKQAAARAVVFIFRHPATLSVHKDAEQTSAVARSCSCDCGPVRFSFGHPRRRSFEGWRVRPSSHRPPG
jgi:hypothetical protein